MNNIINIFIKEIRELFRDKKAIKKMMITPILVPVMVIGMSALFNMEMNKPIEEYNKIGFNYKLSEEEKQIAEQLNIEVIEKDTEELKEEYKNKEIHLYIIKEENNYEINGNDNETTSYAIGLIRNYFSIYKEQLQDKFLNEKNIDADDIINIITTTDNIKENENFFSDYVKTYGFLFIIMAITTATMQPATDTTAGEKERGTLETLLTFPIKSKDIIIGKYLSVALSSMVIGFISLILFIISLNISNVTFEMFKDINLMLSIPSLIITILIVIAYSLLVSGLAIALASKCKTFKEAQSALIPLTYICFFPSMIIYMMGIESSTILAAIPFINYTSVYNEMVSGNINILNIILMFTTTTIAIILVLKLIIKQYKTEKILFQ